VWPVPRVRAGRVVPALGVRALAPGVRGRRRGTCEHKHCHTSTTPVLTLQGRFGRLILWVSRISADSADIDESIRVQRFAPESPIGSSATGGGLARQEIKQATSDDALISTPPDIPDEDSFVIAEEVQSVAFRYFDGTAWQDSWDGTQTDSTGASTGPPQAVEITVAILPPSSDSSAGGNSNLKTYRHVWRSPPPMGRRRLPLPAPTNSDLCAIPPPIRPDDLPKRSSYWPCW